MRTGRRTGRRPGNHDTRGHILDVAFAAFLQGGYEHTSVRGIARRAGVDPALVHRYFGSKKDLFLAAIQIRIDPTAAIEAISADNPGHLGARVVYFVTGIWELRLGPEWIASIRNNPGLIRVMIGFLSPHIAEAVRRNVGVCPEEARLRGALVELVMAGLAMTRYVAELDPLATVTREDLAQMLGPALDHLMTAELPTGWSRRQSQKSSPAS